MYHELYGFSASPFRLTPDPDFFFESSTQRKALSYLGFGLAQGEGFIVITGAVGAGKSTLAAHLLATIDRDRLTAAQVVTSSLDATELVHVVGQAFGLAIPSNDKPGALHAIERYLGAEARAGRRCLLVVDEAQNLPVEALEELRMLSNWQLGAHPLLQVLLLGQPEFRARLGEVPALDQLRQRVIASHHLQGIEADEVEGYIEHRLARVGWEGNPAFDPQVYPGLAAASGGIPRRINQLVGQLLLLGAIEQRQRIDPAMLDEVLADAKRDAGSLPAAETRIQCAPGSGAALRDLAAAIAPQPREDELARALAETAQRIASLEARVLEQESTLRHALSMLIGWIEGDDTRRAAA